MKKYIQTIIFLFIAILSSCEKEYLKYSGPEGVYFGVRRDGLINDADGPYQSETQIGFMKLGVTTYTYDIPVLLIGEVKDYDRKFKIIYDRDSTTLEEGEHFKKLEDYYILPAGANKTIVPVEFYATSDLDYSDKRIDLKIIETDQLQPAFENWEPPLDITGRNPAKKFNASRHIIYVNNMMVQPSQWLGSVLANGEEFNSLGAFTRRKMEFITENLGVTYTDFLNEKSMTLLRMVLIAQQLSKILIDRFNEGNPVLEEDGRLMYVEGVPWKSYVGVPY